MKLNKEQFRILKQVGSAAAHLTDLQESLEIPPLILENLIYELICEGFLVMGYTERTYQKVVKATNLVPFKTSQKLNLKVVQ